MHALTAAIALTAALSLAACGGSGDEFTAADYNALTGQPYGAAPAGAGAIQPGVPVQFHGNLGGMDAQCVVMYTQSIGPDGTYLQMGGQIQSATAAYTFKADLSLDGSGYGDCMGVGEQFRIKIEHANGGQSFVLTANPFGGATYYQFHRVQ